MDKEIIYQFLSAHQIQYETTVHKAVFNMEELSSIELPNPDWDAKNLCQQLWDSCQVRSRR